MSEERRKRQQQRQAGNPSAGRKKAVFYLLVVVLVAGGYWAGWYYRNHKYDAFAKCLAAQQAKMYGLYWCPHCLEQKEKFGASFRYVPYVECAIKDSKELAAECKMAGAKLFPSWQFGTGQPTPGVLSLEALSDKTGCSLR
jgi:hypothetical protein